MKFIPSLIRVQVRVPRWPMPVFWLPVCLLWPFFFLLAIPIFVVGLVFVALVDTARVAKFIECTKAFYTLLCEMRGTRVDVESPEARVFISIH